MDEQTQPMEAILVADDDAHILELVAMYLRRAGYQVETAADGDEALRKERELKPSLLVLDIMMPGHDGIQILRALRKRSTVPIIFLTARTSDIDKIAGLRLGADDYVTKPFNPEELVARVETVLRRVSAGAPERPEAPEIHIDDVEVDLDKRAVTVAGRDVNLTPKEFDLLATFARFPNVVLDREQILDLVWGTSFYAVRTVDVHVARLRDKLQKSKLRIETVWGTGYRLATGEH
jgi:DNA-binding response OmpR family regulator